MAIRRYAVANGGTPLPPFVNPSAVARPAGGRVLAASGGRHRRRLADAGDELFLSLVTNPFAENRGFSTPASPSPPRPMLHAGLQGSAEPLPIRTPEHLGAAGGQNKTTFPDPAVGSHIGGARFPAAGSVPVTPYTLVGFALAGGGTNYGLSEGLGGGRSDMFQAAVYGATQVNAAYVSAAVAYAWHRVSTDRFVTVAGIDHLTAGFSANNVGGRIEGGYRFAIPGFYGWPGFGFTPYAALQVQAFRTPSYSEIAASGSPTFALVRCRRRPRPHRARRLVRPMIALSTAARS